MSLIEQITHQYDLHSLEAKDCQRPVRRSLCSQWRERRRILSQSDRFAAGLRGDLPLTWAPTCAAREWVEHLKRCSSFFRIHHWVNISILYLVVCLEMNEFDLAFVAFPAIKDEFQRQPTQPGDAIPPRTLTWKTLLLNYCQIKFKSWKARGSTLTGCCCLCTWVSVCAVDDGKFHQLSLL